MVDDNGNYGRNGLRKFLPIALTIALVNMTAFYILSLWIYSDGISRAEVYWFLFAPILLFFVVTLVVTYFLVRQYRMHCFENSVRPLRGWSALLILSLLVFVLSLGIDALYFLIDPDLSHAFGAALAEILLGTSTGTDDAEMVQKLVRMPLFIQNYVGIGLAIVMGTLGAMALNHFFVKQPPHRPATG